MDKIAIKGDKINGHKIIEYFKSLGASNEKWHWSGESNIGYYFIDNELFIDSLCAPPLNYKLYESWNEFENEYLNKNKMEERNIKISLEKAKEWYKQGGDLKEVALQAFSEDELKDKVFPQSWCEYNIHANINDNRINAGSIPGSADYSHFETEKEAKAFVALGKLIQLRDAYWKADNDWKPDWTCNPDLPSQEKYYIYVDANQVIKGFGYCLGHILVFSTGALRDEFYTNFKDLIEEAKMFL